MAEEVKEYKKIAVERIASSVKLDSAEVEKVLDAFILEAVMPRMFRTGGTVGLLDNNCNDCMATQAREPIRQIR